MGISPFPPQPVKAPVMFQTWRSITFIHWRYDAALLRRFIPNALEIDLCDGCAWISLTPFRVENLRPRFAPPLPWLSCFPETNLRTYVRGPDGHRGIWFFSLDADRLLGVIGAKLSYALPYKWAQMDVSRDGNTLTYHSKRTDAFSDIVIETGENLAPEELDKFLTARFRLYTVILGRLSYAQAEHAPWQLCRATARRLDQSITAAASLSPRGAPILHYSYGVDVRISRPKWQ
jgi:uncharacterized protein YqjF (DUF2071 family)